MFIFTREKEFTNFYFFHEISFSRRKKKEDMPEEYSNDDIIVDEEVEVERRFAWQVTSWILMSLTLILNLVVIFVLLYRQNAYNVVNKGE